MLAIFDRVQFADDTNLKFQDEADAYMAFKARGQFTPNPGQCPSIPTHTHVPNTPDLVVELVRVQVSRAEGQEFESQVKPMNYKIDSFHYLA